MKGTALLLLCAITVAQAAQPRLTLSGKVCHCNPEEAANVCSQNGSDNELIVHENCNQFYKCANGQPIALYCPGITVYNPIAEVCDWPQNVDCGERPIVAPEVPDDESQESSNEGNGQNNGTCNSNPEEAPALCAAAGAGSVSVAHENCNQFYQCANGVPVTQNCPSGLVYNACIQQCDWLFNVDCGDKPIIEIESEGNDNEDCDDNNENETTCNCNPEEAPSICQASGSDGTLVAHENCHQYYICDHGVPISQSCAANLLYNPYTKQCDWSQNVDCGDRYVVDCCNENGAGEEEDCDETSTGNGDNGSGGAAGGNESSDTDNGSSDDNSTGNGGTDNGGGTCNCNPGEAPGICAADGSDGILIAHENCNQYYKCSNDKPVEFFCPVDLVYNPYTQECDWPANVDCGDKPIVEIEEGSGDNGGSDGDCEDGETEGGESGGSDNGGGTCNCNPGEAPGICAADGSDGILIAHENCNQFYKCSNGEAVGLFCPVDLVYNPYTQKCDWPENVNCGDKPIVEIEEGSGDNGGSEEGETEGGESGGSDNGGGTCNCNPGEAPGICAADGSDGILIAHENCNQFYKCSNGEAVGLFCPVDLVYNPYTQKCDWPENVNCGDKPIVEIEEGSGDNGGSEDGETEGGESGGSDNGGGTCNCNPGEAPGICAADGSDGILIAHENCNQFYKCSNGEAVGLFCPVDLVYNPYTQECDWPANVTCGDKPIVEIDEGSGDNGGSDGDCEDGESGGSDNGGDDKEDVDNGSEDNEDIDNGGEDNEDVDNGGEDNEDVDNDDKNVSDNDDKSSDVDEDCEESENGNACNCNPNEAANICGRPGSDGSFVAHENCNQFYQCAHGVPVAVFCPAGLLYNPYLQRCTWPNLVLCEDRPIVENDAGGENNESNEDVDDSDNDNEDNSESTCNCNPEEAQTICSATGSDGTFVAHENCNQFYMCSNGLAVAVFCSGNLLYNAEAQRCDWPSTVTCGDRPIVEVIPEENDGEKSDESTDIDGACDPSQAPSICSTPGSDGIIVAHENCNQFYVCSHGAPSAVNCPSNLFYNPNTKDCDWPINVDCGDRIVPDDGGNDGPCACDARQAPSICAGENSNGKLIAHENCSQYYVCFEGTPVARSCPKNLYYDPNTERCIWPVSVNCGGRYITSTYAFSSLNKHLQARRGFL